MDVLDTVPVQSASMAGSSVSSKVSIFGSKSGFVIPRNKLSGSLVPAFRSSGKKIGGLDSTAEETSKHIRRKTKWGPDLSQDPSVRKGRLLAYQTRLEQITRQLVSENVGVEGDDGDFLGIDGMEEESVGRQIDKELLKSLEIERLESIGEILKLNTSYKAPSDYKPIMRVENVPVPVKEFPSYNFIGLLFGPGNDTLKRLEKETGAKLQVRGKKTGTEDECEVSQADAAGESCGAFEELHLRVLGETFEKVDAAVSLIELLVKPVSGCQGNTPAPPSTPPPPDHISLTGSTRETPTTTHTQVSLPQTQAPIPQHPQTLPQSSPWPPQLHISSPGYRPPINTTTPPTRPPPFTILHPHPPPPIPSNTPPSLSSNLRQSRPPITATINPSGWGPPSSGSISVHLRLPPGQPFHIPTAFQTGGPRYHQNTPQPFCFQTPPPHPNQPSPGPDNCVGPMPFLPPLRTPGSDLGSFPNMRMPPPPSPRPHPCFSDFTFQPHIQPFRPGTHPPTETAAVSQFTTGNRASIVQQLPPPPPLPNFGSHFPVRYPPASASASASLNQQIYDPFSPTSQTHLPPKESDPEYDDLMASVGVK